MKNLFNNIHLFVLFLFFSVTGYAQLYPVQLTPVFNSPYSVKISDYATSMDTKMQLLINPTDISISQRQVRLKLYIQGNGLNIQSSDFIQGQRPIFINGGELQTLTNTDISALFRLENLQGISPAQYANPLPEGMYNFCFEMYDFVTNQKISQKSCASLYLILNDPPLLNTPQKNEQIASTEFPNILFTWTPRQINASNISYKFELKQLIDPTLDPQIGFQMSPILYEETLFGTALLYNLSMPILTPGLRYAWRVKAISTTGLSENAVFKNDGYSEIYSFKYTASCAAPTFLLSESQSSKSVKITWEGIPEHTRYQVQYKKQDVRNAQWFSSYSLNKQTLITNLEPGVTYQFRVGSSCDPVSEGVQSFTYSGINTFTTPVETSGVPAYNCGIVPQINIQNQTPLTNLIESETFKAGDFPVTVLELKGENSPYSGRGYIIVPYLNEIKIAVQFSNITINTDYQLINGVVETAYDPKWGNVVNIKDVINDVKESVKNIISEIKDFLNNYKGTTEDKIKATEYEKEQNELSKQLLADNDLPQDVKERIIEAQQNAKESWENLKTAKPCPEITKKDENKKGGPRSFFYAFEDNFDCNKIPVEKQTEANDAGLKVLEELQAETLKKLAITIKSLGTDTFIKCKKCEANTSTTTSSIDKGQLAFKIKNKLDYYSCLLASIKEDNKLDFILFDTSKGVLVTENQDFLSFIENVKSIFSSKKENVLALINGEQQITNCTVIYPFDATFCNEKNPELTDVILKNIAEELEKCYVSELKEITQNLISLKKDSRTNQGVEYVKNGKVYALNGNGEAEEVKNPLTDDDIRNGKWTDGTIDVKIRVTQNKDGVFQYQAVGIRKNLQIFGNKKADLLKLAKNIETKANAFLNSLEHKVIKVDDTPAKAGVNLNSSNEVFADGDNMNINQNSSYFKIIDEGIGLMTTLLKSGEVEENTYLDSTKPSTTVHAPGIVTASVEVIATKVTDLTSMGTMVYDLSVDKQARAKAYTDFIEIKNQVGNDPKTFVPILGEVILNISTGNSAEQWQQSIDKNADVGKKNHLATRGVENAVITVVTGSKIISELPEISEKLVENIKKVKKISKEFVENPFDEFKKLKKSVRYRQGEFGYFTETDEFGRIDFAETENLQLSITERAKHNGNTPGKLEGDHAGHVFGDRFGGSPELDNLVSQASNVNLSKFKVIENRWAKALKNGEKVEVKIKVIYEGNDLRPSKFQIEYIIDGKYNELEILN